LRSLKPSRGSSRMRTLSASRVSYGIFPPHIALQNVRNRDGMFSLSVARLSFPGLSAVHLEWSQVSRTSGPRRFTGQQYSFSIHSFCVKLPEEVWKQAC
jgi:hypothetical protein